MDVFLRIDINIMAIVLLGLVSLNAYKSLDRQDLLNRVFLIVSLIIIVQLFFETSTCIIEKRPEQWLIPISVFLHICLFAVAPILTYYWYFFIKNLVVSGEAAVKKSNFVLLVPIIVSIVLTLLSPVYNYVFYIDSSNVYHRGPLYNTNMAITYFYIVYGSILVVMNRKRIVKQDFVPLCIFSVLPIIGGIVQTLFYGTLLMWSGAAYSLVIVYVFLQQRMVHLDALTGIWNRGSFDYYISQRINQGNSDELGIIYFDIDGLKKLTIVMAMLKGTWQ